MIQALLEKPEILRALRSMAVAVPFERDPWGTVAQGLRMDRGALVEALSELQRTGVIHGVWGEPNPALEEAKESLVEFADDKSFQPAPGQVVRWRARKAGGGWLASVNAIGRSAGIGWEATRFAKAGLPLQGTGGTPDLLRPGADRTHLVNGERLHIPPLEYEEVQIADRLFIPITIDLASSFWSQVSAGIRYGEEETRLLARKLVYHQVWRRLAVRLNPAKLGWSGCGLACWKLAEEDLAEATAALAGIQSTGDVVSRRATTAWPYNLSAIVLARESGGGKSAAEKISAQWGRQLGCWLDLEIH